ncbi:MAG TPA: permease-like cell division protein FtsX [Thermoleophilaceae bacterium]
MRLGFFVKEAFRALSRNAAPSLAAMLTILLTALVLGVFIPVVQATTSTANQVRSRVVVDVYVAQGTTPADKLALRQKLEQAPNVKRVEYISKEQALATEKKRHPNSGWELLGSNPLPDSFRVTPVDPDGVQQIVDRLFPAGADGKRHGVVSSIGDVRNREQDTKKILSATGIVKLLAAGLAGLLVFASIALVANTIRLSIFARRREVEVMRLVGATNWFIRWPFVIEGIFVGFMGGALAILLLWIVKDTFLDPLSDRFALIALPDTITFPALVAVLLGSCVAVSAVGSGVTLRRFLKV